MGPHLAQDSKQDEPEPSADASNSRGAQREADDAIVLRKDVDGHAGGQDGQEAVAPCSTGPSSARMSGLVQARLWSCSSLACVAMPSRSRFRPACAGEVYCIA